MKKWPENQITTVAVDELITPVIKLFRKSVKFPEKDHEYTGYEHGPDSAATCLSGADLARASVREYQQDNFRGLDEQFILLAFQLGFEQGRRHTIRHLKYHKKK